jgi:SAM-dependent methyltransferase
MKIKEKNIKDVVKSKYNQIADQSLLASDKPCCCGSKNVEIDYSIFGDDYSGIKGYQPDADLGLGCGIPTEFAKISEGETVLDLGSGAGNDCFVVRSIVGEKGKVIGLDFAPNMLKKSRQNAEKLGYTNVEFVKGDIEEMPIADNSIDTLISNCVLNLVPDKKLAFKQIHRVLKPSGHFCVSDVVLTGDLPELLLKDAELYVGCVAGAIKKQEYLDIIQKNGFKNIEVKKEKKVAIPDHILVNFLTFAEIEEFKNGDTGIYSITVYAEK